MTEIEPLKIVTFPSPQPKIVDCADVIRVLEKTLASARAGQITDVAIACVLPGGGIASIRAGNESLFLLLGSVAHMQHSINEEISALPDKEFPCPTDN